MSKVVAFLLVILCAVSATAQAQPPQAAAPNPWTVSVVHTVDFQTLVEWMKRQSNQRIAVPASPPAFVYNFATGMVIDDQGHVVTRLVNLTPIDKSPVINVTTADGTAHPAKLVGIDGATGFAVLEVTSLKSGAPKVALPDTLTAGTHVQILSTDVQQQVQATPEGARVVYLPAITIAQGSVGPSSIYAKLRGALTVYSGSLMSRNDSSVVTTPDNQLAGIAQYAGFGRAYLFPVSYIRDTVVRRVVEKKGFVPAGWLGARGDSIAQLSDAEFGQLGLPSRAGVVLRQVAPASPAAVSGMQPGDVILSIDGFNIVGAAELIALLSMSPEGRKVTVRASRNHQMIEMVVSLGARPDSEWVYNFSPLEQQFEPLDVQRALLEKRLDELKQEYGKLGQQSTSREAEEARREIMMQARNIYERLREIDALSHQPSPAVKPSLSNEIIVGNVVAGPLSDQLATYLKVKGGVWVRQVPPGSIAERVGLKGGDVIISVQGQELTSVDQLIRLLNVQNTEITLKVIRKEQPVTLTFVSN